jgi:hypothetical protein
MGGYSKVDLILCVLLKVKNLFLCVLSLGLSHDVVYYSAFVDVQTCITGRHDALILHVLSFLKPESLSRRLAPARAYNIGL